MRAFILRRVGADRGGGSGSVLVGRPDIAGSACACRASCRATAIPTRCSTRTDDGEGRAAVERLGVLARRTAADGLPERHRAETPDRRRGRRLPRHHARARSGQGLRRGGGRRRAGGPGDGGLCARPRACRCWCSTSAPSAARPAPRRGSRTISAFRPASPARRWPAAPSTRRRSSAPRSPSRSRWRGWTATPRDRRAASAGARPTARRCRRATVVIASGARYRRPDIANLADFEGAGVSYWASPVEAKLCEGEEVALVGGGNSAGQAVVFLAPKVERLHLIVRGDGPRGDHVALSDRPHRGAAERRAAHRHRDRRRWRATARAA